MQVRVNRVKRLRDAGRSYKVLLDRETVAKVAGGKSTTFDAVPGEHRLQCSIDRATSAEVVFVAADAGLVFECEAGEGRLSARGDARHNRGAYLQLRQVP